MKHTITIEAGTLIDVFLREAGHKRTVLENGRVKYDDLPTDYGRGATHGVQGEPATGT